MGLRDKWVKYSENFIYFFIPIFFWNSPTAGQIRQRIFTLDSSNDADSRKGMHFGGFVDIAFYFGGEPTPTLFPILGA